MGYNLYDSCSQIIPLVAGVEKDAFELRSYLEKNGIYGSIFIPPATGMKRALVRLSANSSLSISDLEKVVAVCSNLQLLQELPILGIVGIN